MTENDTQFRQMTEDRIVKLGKLIEELRVWIRRRERKDLDCELLHESIISLSGFQQFLRLLIANK